MEGGQEVSNIGPSTSWVTQVVVGDVRWLFMVVGGGFAVVEGERELREREGLF